LGKTSSPRRDDVLRTLVLLCLATLSATYRPRSDAPRSPTGEGAAATSLSARSLPEALTAAEEADPATAALARRFNPAMAFPIEDIWPVEVRYAWHDGADLVARVEAGAGQPGQEYVAARGRDLSRTDWSRLPVRARDGRPIRYFVDGPGDDRPSGVDGLSRWRRRWRQVVQPEGPDQSPALSAYRPTQYAHVYWWDRAQGLLAIQYWFYYPFNEWVNRHEGDWERIQIILRGPSQLDAQAAFTPVAHQFFFHEFWTQPTQMVRLAGAEAGEDHPLVYVGGQGRFLLWSGTFSGGSYPLPARFPGAGFRGGLFAPDDDASRPARFIAASDFQVILLPEPERLDARRNPELSWLRLPFYAGQRSMSTNPPGYALFGRDHPPLQPAARDSWLRSPRKRAWAGHPIQGDAAGAGAMPDSWACVRPADPSSCAAHPTRRLAARSERGLALD
jgi:hypothetical protein